jgi:hypothetical protein
VRTGCTALSGRSSSHATAPFIHVSRAGMPGPPQVRRAGSACSTAAISCDSSSARAVASANSCADPSARMSMNGSEASASAAAGRARGAGAALTSQTAPTAPTTHQIAAGSMKKRPSAG